MQAQLCAAAGAVVHLEAETVQVDDGGDDRQAKAEPAVFVVATVKPLEHSFALGFGNARAGVEDVNAHAAFVVDGAQCLGPRVAARVAAGGHDVPTDKLADRYARLWPHVVTAVPHCHRTIFYDNSRDDGPLEVAAYRRAIPDYAPKWPRWTPGALLTL